MVWFVEGVVVSVHVGVEVEKVYPGADADEFEVCIRKDIAE